MIFLYSTAAYDNVNICGTTRKVKYSRNFVCNIIRLLFNITRLYIRCGKQLIRSRISSQGISRGLILISLLLNIFTCYSEYIQVNKGLVNKIIKKHTNSLQMVLNLHLLWEMDFTFFSRT